MVWGKSDWVKKYQNCNLRKEPVNVPFDHVYES